MALTEHLFVYGSLAPGEENAHHLSGLEGSWVPAKVKGYLKKEGWGASLGFPGIILDERGETVNGFVFSSQELIVHWKRLDEFEGEEYERVLTSVQTANGNIEAYVYRLKGN